MYSHLFMAYSVNSRYSEVEYILFKTRRKGQLHNFEFICTCLNPYYEKSLDKTINKTHNISEVLSSQNYCYVIYKRQISSKSVM